jgi:diguanylate cyclase (GGDEF)-like protein/PAS domain S-box-containing protein
VPFVTGSALALTPALRSGWSRANLQYLARVLGVALVYCGAAKGGLALAYENSSVTAVWAPTGIALATLLLWGYRLWPGVALGALLANAWTGVPLATVLGITSGNTLEALVGAYLLLRVARFRPSLERVRDVLALVFLAAVLSTMVSATVGVASLRLGDAVSASDLPSVWRTWWLGDMAGDLLVAPFLLLAGQLRAAWRPERITEAAALLLTVIAVGVVTLSTDDALVFLIFPVLTWAALRFRQAGAAAGSLIVAGVAVAYTAQGSGPFVQDSPDTSLLLSQTFMGAAGVTSLLLAAVMSERRRAERTLRSAHDELGVRVRQRTAELRRSTAELELQSAVAAHMAEGVALIRASDGVVVYANPTFERMFGYESGELDGLPASIVNAPSENTLEQIVAALREHGTWSGEVENVRKNGTRFWCWANISRFDHHEHGPVWVWLHTDISERKLSEETARLARIVESSEEAIVGKTLDGEIVAWNAAAERMYGFSAEEAIGQHVCAMISPGREQELADLLRRIASGERIVGFETTRVTKGGRELEVSVTLSPIKDPQGRIIGASGFDHDITELKSAQRGRRQAEERFRRAFEDSAIGVAILGVDPKGPGRFLEVNDAFCQLYGYPRQQLLEMSYSQLVHPDETHAAREEIRRLLAGELESYHAELRCLHARGHTIWIGLTTSLVRDKDGNPLYRVCQVYNITDRKRSEHRLRYLADHDPLTDLLNRRRFEEELSRELAAAKRYGSPGALLVLDLDHFKYVNDSLGHAAGDELVVRVAASLRGRLRESDLLARLGGDEFAAILPRTDEQAARTVAAGLLEVVRESASPRGGRPHWVTASVGIAPFSGTSDRITSDQLLMEGDMAMYEAKEAGRDRIAVHDPSAPGSMAAGVSWADRIRTALAEDGFILYAQPILGLTGDRSSCQELLLRMERENGEVNPPADFLPVAERIGLIEEIDRWVVCRAIDLLAQQQRAGRDVRLHVNLSAKSITNADLPLLVGQELAASGADPSGLCFEVTETAAVVDLSRASDFAHQVTELGCELALDDFGAGFGSFQQLKNLEFDYIKIDGGFIRDLGASRVDELVVKSVVEIARGLGKRTVAEFVEDESALRLVREYGVDYAQGFHVGEPRLAETHMLNVSPTGGGL